MTPQQQWKRYHDLLVAQENRRHAMTEPVLRRATVAVRGHRRTLPSDVIARLVLMGLAIAFLGGYMGFSLIYIFTH